MTVQPTELRVNFETAEWLNGKIGEPMCTSCRVSLFDVLYQNTTLKRNKLRYT